MFPLASASGAVLTSAIVPYAYPQNSRRLLLHNLYEGNVRHVTHFETPERHQDASSTRFWIVS